MRNGAEAQDKESPKVLRYVRLAWALHKDSSQRWDAFLAVPALPNLIAIVLLMAVPSTRFQLRSGEVVRALITSGLGGDNTVNRIWLDTRTATASGSFVGDLEVASTLPGSVTRLIWHTAGQFRLIFVSGGLLAKRSAAGGSLNGKHILICVQRYGPTDRR